ncbi:MAG: acetyl-CoA carboxylase biotin carboxylase subunit, partial [Bacteroidetes bacterium]|nr:acetyl-CoA carboxylase biotin carboxylase subunit [Bacteroidota bacterium]
YIPSGGIGVRIDTHVYSGYSIPPFYDSMIAKLIVKAPNRQQAIEKMKRALAEMKIEGIHTTIPFHQKLMNNKDFVAGNFTTKFLEEHTFDYEDDV